MPYHWDRTALAAQSWGPALDLSRGWDAAKEAHHQVYQVVDAGIRIEPLQDLIDRCYDYRGNKNNCSRIHVYDQVV